jgi:hypothetical protein
VGGEQSAALRNSEVRGVFLHDEECQDNSDARRTDVGVREGIDRGVLDELLQEAFAAQLALFRTQIQDIVAEAIRPLRKASVDLGFGGFFGPCSPVLRISSLSSMATSIATGCAAYEDKGGLPIGVRSEKMQNAALLEDGVEGSLVEDQSEAWIKPDGALSSVEVGVVTGVGMGPFDASVPESAVIAEVVAPVLQVMPELQELCGELSVVLPMELGSLEASAVSMTPSPPPLKPCQAPVIVDSGDVLGPNFKALFGKEVFDLLVSLEAASPGYGMDIACVLVGKASEDIIKKVEKSFRSKRKKMVFS